MKLQTFAYWALAILFVVVGLAHFVSVAQMSRFLPEWVPLKAAGVVATGVLELLLAIGLWIPQTRKWAGRVAFALLILYTPLHVMDVMRDAPVIGPKVVAIIRLPLQLVLLYLAWLVGWGKKTG